MFSSNTSQVSGGAVDPDFENVTMLLHGDGTNGGQNNTFLDSSTNNFTITRNGNTTQGSFSPYGPNWSNYFTNDYIRTTSTLGSFASDFTVECWIYSPGNGPVPWCLGDYSLSSGLIVQLFTNGIGIETNAASLASFSTTAWRRNTWVHVALVRNSGVITIYIDGVSVGSVASTATFSGSFIIGGLNYAGNINNGGTQYISNLRVTNTAVYTSNFTPSTTPLTAISGTQLLTSQSNRFIDNSASARSMTVVGSSTSVQRFSPFAPTAAYSTATIGGSGYFDGAGDSLTIADSTQTDLGSGNFTVECWFYQFSAKVTSCVSLNTVTGTGYAMGASTTANKTWWYANNASQILSSATFDYNTWNHLAVVRNGGTTTMYLNGASVGSFSDSINYSGTTTFIGSDEFNQFWNGYISGARIVKGTAVYTSNFTPPTAPPSAVTNTQLLLNFTNAAIFDNAMMNDLETVGNAQISTSVVKFGTGSIAFDGTGDYLIPNVPTSDLYAFGTGDFTVEFWVYANSFSGGPIFLDWRPSGANGVYPTLYFTSGGVMTYFTNSSDRITSSALSTGIWYHVAVCRSGTSTRMFVNGTQAGSTYTDSNNYLCPAARPVIAANGSSFGTSAFNGYIDDLRITKGVARYTANFTPPTAAFPNL